jgi:hypothetical protein
LFGLGFWAGGEFVWTFWADGDFAWTAGGVSGAVAVFFLEVVRVVVETVVLVAEVWSPDEPAGSAAAEPRTRGV